MKVTSNASYGSQTGIPGTYDQNIQKEVTIAFPTDGPKWKLECVEAQVVASAIKYLFFGN